MKPDGARKGDAESEPKPLKNYLHMGGEIVFPIFAAWVGGKAILEQKAGMRFKGHQAREVWMFGQDAIEFGIGLLLFAFATHVLLYKQFLPERYHRAIVWIFRVAAGGGVVCWGLSSL